MMHHNALSAALAAASIGLPLASATLGLDQPDTTTTTRQPDTNKDRDRDMHRDTNRDMNRDSNRDSWQNTLRSRDMKNDQPGELHDWIKKFDGSWDIVVDAPTGGWKDMNNPGRTLSESERTARKTGTAKTDMVLDGRYAHMMVTCNDKVSGFEGMQLIGYNNDTHRFESMWADNHGTGMTVLVGDLDSDRKVLTLTGEDPRTSYSGVGGYHAYNNTSNSTSTTSTTDSARTNNQTGASNDSTTSSSNSSGNQPTKTTAGQPGSPGSSTTGTTGTGAAGAPGSGAAQPGGNNNTNQNNTTTSNNQTRTTTTGSMNNVGRVRQVIRWTSPTSFVSEVYRPNASGTEDRMVVTFTKRDAGNMGAAPTRNP